MRGGGRHDVVERARSMHFPQMNFPVRGTSEWGKKIDEIREQMEWHVIDPPGTQRTPVHRLISINHPSVKNV